MSEEDNWCHYSGMPSPNAYNKKKKMGKKKKLKVGDQVLCKFLGASHKAVVTEVTSPGKYKLRYYAHGTYTNLPNAEWYNAKDKKAAAKPWHIHEYLGSKEPLKTEIKSDIQPKTTSKKELKKAIKKQKDFIRGNIKK
jgi:hypothetical protein